MSAPYLIHPKNKDFIHNRVDLPPSLPSTLNVVFAVIVLLPFILAGVFMIYMTFNHYQEQNKLQQTIETTAIITDRTIRTGENATRYILSYQYQVDGTTFDYQQNVQEALYQAHEIDQPITIVYSQDDPSIVRIVGTDQQSNLILFIFGTGVWLLFTGGISFFVIRSYLKGNRLRKHGRLINGELIHIKGETTGEDYYVTVVASLTSPETKQPIQGERHYMANALQGEPFPPEGTPLAIYYANDKQWEIL